MTLSNTPISESFKSLLRVNDNTSGVDTALERVTDGEGTSSGILLADNGMQVKPTTANNAEIFTVTDLAGNFLFKVDATNSVVKANVGQEILNTQYAYFNVSNIDSYDFVADTHQAIPFGGNGIGDLSDPPPFGTDTDPATSFTTSSSAGTKASDLTPCIWYVPDNITIDSVNAIVGADQAGGETLNLHLFSYQFNTGSTSALSDGTLLAYSHSNNNDGDEQPYKYTYSIEAANKNVTGGRVILAFLECVSTVSSDYSVQVIVKYHLT